jgi:hypothetical protein
MCEVAPESAHHSVVGVRVLVESEMLKTLALTADSAVEEEVLALLAEEEEEFEELLEEELEELEAWCFFLLDLLALALALSCS